MKRIGLLIPHMLHGGAEKVISELSFILSNNYEVYLILFEGENISYDYAGTLIDMNCKSKATSIGKSLNIFKRIIKLNKIKKEHELDLIISFLRSANIVNFLSNKKNKKIISCRGFSDYKKSSYFYAKMIKNIDGIIFPSNTMVNQFIETYHPEISKVFLLNNPLDVRKIDLMKDEDINNDLLDFINSHNTICTLGSFKKDKGFWNLIKAFSLLKQRVPNAGLVFIGDRGEMESNIIKMANEGEFAQDIVFTGYQENPYKILSKCNLYVMSSLNEGFPNALIEAMACRIPVISTDCKSGPREILQKYADDKNRNRKIEELDYGVLVPNFNESIDFDYNNIEETHSVLAEAMYQLLVNDNLSSKYKTAGLKRVKNYDTEHFTKKIHEILAAI